MSKQDRQGVRTAPDLERKYDFGKSFKEVRESVRAVGKTAEQAVQKAEEADETFRSQILQLSNSIKLEVTGSESGKMVGIKLYVGTGDDAQAYEGKIDLTGMVTFTDLETEGSTVINGSNITTGEILADLIKAGVIKSKDGTSVVMDLDNGKATLTGSITAVDGNTKSVLSAGMLSMFYDSVRYGFLSSMNWGGTDAPKGVTLCCTDDAKFFSIGYDADGSESYAGKYVINLGANPSGYTERHHFYDDVRFRGNAVLPKTPTDDSHVVNKAYVDGIASQTLERARHRNLLDNWYFADPINQRGSTALKVAGYFIDRWKMETYNTDTASATVQKSAGFITLGNSADASTSNSTKLVQVVDNASQLAGKTVTFSVSFSYISIDASTNGPRISIYSKGASAAMAYTRITTDHAYGIATVTTTLADDITYLEVRIGNDASYGGKGNFSFYIKSAKLEIGSVSTLANDEPPKYSEQLLECQRYFIRYSNTVKQQAFTGGANGTAVYAAVQLPTAMRGTDAPTVSYSGLDIYNFVSGGSVAVKSCGGNMLASRNNIVLWATYTATTDCPAQTPASIRIGEGGYIDISCDI